MSRNSAVLEKAVLEASRSSPAQPRVDAVAHLGEYLELIRGIFYCSSAVAIIGSGLDVSCVCEGIASELAASGKRVIVVPVKRLLAMNPISIPDETAFVPAGKAPNVWLWPSPVGERIEFFKSRAPENTGNWLDALRRNFDSVLLDCGSVDVTSGVVEFVTMADAAVLVVEAGRTPKRQIQSDQRALQLRGAKLAGCVLIRRR